MGCLAKCNCEKCCDYSEGLPYSTAKLTSPFYDCNPGGGVGGGVGVGVGEGEGENPPNYPIESFAQVSDCCLRATFNFSCTPVTFACQLWAKRHYDFSYSVDWYKARVAYSDDADPGECPCVKVQTKSVDFNGIARIWYLYKYKLQKIEITAGQANVKCEGDSDPVCRWFVAATYVYCVAEDFQTTFWTRKDFDCIGQFEAGNCSFSNAWIEETGTNSDACPFSEYPGGNDMSGTFCGGSEYRFTRIRFFDAKPTGPVTITDSDTLPVSCCDDKTSCNIVGNDCGGMSLASPKCTPFLPAFSNDTWIVFCDYEYELLRIKDPNSPSTCPDVVTDLDPTPYATDSFGPGSDYNKIGLCVGDGVKTQSLRYEVGSSGSNIKTAMCQTFEDDCMTGGPNPPDPEFCTTGFTCQSGLEVFDCVYLAGFCGREISDFVCTQTTDSFNVGSICFPVPSVTVELTA